MGNNSLAAIYVANIFPTLALVIFFINPQWRICSLIFRERQKGRGRGKEKGRESEWERRRMGGREKHQSVASHMCPDQGLNLQPFDAWVDTQNN